MYANFRAFFSLSVTLLHFLSTYSIYALFLIPSSYTHSLAYYMVAICVKQQKWNHQMWQMKWLVEWWQYKILYYSFSSLLCRYIFYALKIMENVLNEKELGWLHYTHWVLSSDILKIYFMGVMCALKFKMKFRLFHGWEIEFKFLIWSC